MVGVKISALASASSLTGAELVPVVQSGVTKKATANQILAVPVTATDSTTARALADRFADIVNVKDYGAVGDGATDDTAAIQDAIDEAVSRGGASVWFPAGSYLVSAALTLSDAGLVNLVGNGANASAIIMDAANTPIFSFTECGTGRPDFHISGLTLEYATAAAISDTNSVALAFETGAGTPAFGYYNFSIRDVTIRGCHTGISNRFGATPPNLWGFDIQALRVQDFAYRAWDITNTGTGGGSPNSSIRNAYLLGRSGLTYTSNIAWWDCGDAYTIENLEVNRVSFNASTGVVYLGGSRSGKLGPLRFEAVDFLGGVAPALVMVETHYASIIGLVLAFCSAASGVTACALRTGTGAQATLENVQAETITGAGVIVGALESSAGQVLFYSMASPNSGQWLRNGGYFAPRVELHSDGVVHVSVSVSTPTVQAPTSAGLSIKNSSGIEVALFGPGPGTGSTFQGGVNINGNTTLGDATSDTVTLTARLASGLTWATDNTNDIGASGTNRPRDLFLARNAAIAGTLDVVGTHLQTGALYLGPSRTNLSGVGAVQAQIIGTGFSGTGFSQAQYSADASGPFHILAKTRGAAVGTNTAVQAGDSLGIFQWRGADGSTTLPGAQIFAVAASPIASGSVPAYMGFAVTPSGSGAPTERMRIGTDGSISLCAAPGAESLRALPVASAVNRVEVYGSITGGAPGIYAAGSDTNVPLILGSKGAASVRASTGSGTQVLILDTASVARTLNLTGATSSGDPTISASAGAVAFGAPVKLPGYTVGTLPTAGVGRTAYVTDANATTYNSIVAGGGANIVTVYADGTNWRIG